MVACRPFCVMAQKRLEGHACPVYSCAMRILLHLCCGPCGLMPTMRLREEGFELAGFFYNPNIHPLTEYLRRRESVLLAAKKLDLPLLLPDQDDPRTAWNLARWLRDAHRPDLVPQGPESTDRCDFCYADRLMLAAQCAKEGGFDGFSTSLLYSLMQRHNAIRTQGEAAAARYDIHFIYRDFRPDWQAGIDLSKDWELYRQNYCGCIYSEADRFTKKLDRLCSI